MTQLTHASTKSASRTGSSASLEFRNGRLVAITHHVPKTGYKSIHSHGHEKPRFIAETTSQTAQKACFAAPSGSKKKPLEKYHPWAARSRPKQFTENVVGRRFGFTSTSETYRGSSQISLGDESVKNTFETTNRAFQRVSVASRASKEKSVSMTTNQGIASDVARRLHATLIPKPPLETTF